MYVQQKLGNQGAQAVNTVLWPTSTVGHVMEWHAGPVTMAQAKSAAGSACGLTGGNCC
jgi:hypothetical protein